MMKNKIIQTEPTLAIILPKSEIVDKGTPCGEKFYFKAKLSRDGEKKIAEPGEKINLDAQIQAYKASTDIVSIIARLEAGDTSVLNVNKGISGDITVLPKDINGMLDGLNGSEVAYQQFMKLPEDVRKLFNNDPSAFYNAVIENRVNDILADLKKGEGNPEPEKTEKDEKEGAE